MTCTHTSHRQSEQGFTLVELAIVMVIIGLLIGGILKGQELIANARISATVTQLKGLDAALNTFEDKYNARPGLMGDAATRLPGCATPCANVTGNPTGYGAVGTAPTAVGDSKVQAFIHLSAADLISGIDATGATPVAFGKALPAAKAGGGMWIGTASGVADGITSGRLTPGFTYAALNGSVANLADTTGVITGTSAAQIDRKLDDGQPRTGSVQASGGTCVLAGPPAAYDEAAGANCVMVARVKN